ncbi:MAG: flagellar hook-basal body protein [Oscillospiraceae bacterium]|nr:flagellar hook-basal body protein [Oscillospiraceae bacterium]
MNISFHTGKSAMIAQAKALNVYGNNIANVNTVGYQTLRPDFADCIYVKEREPQPDWQTGHGTYIQKTDLMFSEAHLQFTDRMMDIAIPGEGFFAVQDRWGDVNYTRDGAFEMTQDQETGDWYLVSGNGEYVLDYNKERIVVPFDEWGKQPEWGELCDMVGVFVFPNPYGLAAFGSNRYVENGKSGLAVADENMAKVQGALVVSNVDLATQMVKLIETQRAYQISSRVVTTSDELARIANNLR